MIDATFVSRQPDPTPGREWFWSTMVRDLHGNPVRVCGWATNESDAHRLANKARRSGIAEASS